MVQERDAVRRRPAAQVPRQPVPRRRGRLVDGADGRGAAHRPAHRRDPGRGRACRCRYTAYTPCFRREKMSAGRDVRGIKRGHQFDKVEMYMFCQPEDSDAELEQMRADAEATCAGAGPDLPRQAALHRRPRLRRRASPTTSRSGRRAAASGWRSPRSRTAATSRPGAPTSSSAARPAARPEFVHTLNGSGLGLPRTLIAVLENYQQADGSRGRAGGAAPVDGRHRGHSPGVS